VLLQAMFFNPPGTDVHECAKALKDIAEKRIKRLPKAPTSSSKSSSSVSALASSAHHSDSPGVGTPNSGGGGTAADQRKMADMMRKMEQMQRDLELVKSTKGSSAKKPADPSAKKKSSANNANRAMSFEEKRTLSLNINKLPHDKLGKVVEIIKKRRSNVMGNSEEIEIDIDLLDNATLRELDKYVRETLNPSKPKAPAPSKAAALQSAVQEVVGSVGAQAVGGLKPDSDSESESSDSDAD
jgi:acetylornithine deacetylase/succinyl-diaminopimelate desuccinylase-like protein